jgi:aspartyl-tRNA(Asn)/glutamyl-tRNA(Gln) amidotransferase subunit C
MSKINKEEIERLAGLSKLQFSETEKDELIDDMSRILTFVEKLNEVDTDGVEPLLHMSEAKNVLRDDIPKTTITQQDGLKNAPVKDSDFFKVPKVKD